MWNPFKTVGSVTDSIKAVKDLVGEAIEDDDARNIILGEIDKIDIVTNKVSMPNFDDKDLIIIFTAIMSICVIFMIDNPMDFLEKVLIMYGSLAVGSRLK